MKKDLKNVFQFALPLIYALVFGDIYMYNSFSYKNAVSITEIPNSIWMMSIFFSRSYF